MKLRTTFNIFWSTIAVAVLWAPILPEVHAGTPQYQIYDIGVVQVDDEASQGFGASPAGIAVGRSLSNNGSQAFTWTLNGGIVGLPNLAGRSYCVSNSTNDSGIVVGTGYYCFRIRPITGGLAKWRGFAASTSGGPNARRRELGERFSYCCGFR
jgi:hypothetical protein